MKVGMCYGGYIAEATPAHCESSMDTQSHPTVGPVVGLKNIGELFGRCGRTVRRWIDSEDFPASRLPDGAWATTHTLIDEWLFARSDIQLDDGDEPQATTYL